MKTKCAPILIGLTGRKQSGKTTAALYLERVQGFRHTSFAEPMRRFAAEVLGLTPEQLEAEKERPVAFLDGQVTPRQFLQRLGTEFGRDMIHRELWVRSCMARVDLTRNTVISDVRFDNEALAIRERGGIVIEIVRPHRLCRNDTHTSEAGVSPELIDIHLVNDNKTVWPFYVDLQKICASAVLLGQHRQQTEKEQ